MAKASNHRRGTCNFEQLESRHLMAAGSALAITPTGEWWGVRGQSIRIEAAITHPTSGVVTGTVDFGDGQSAQQSADLPASSGMYFPHTYATAGKFVCSMAMHDGSGHIAYAQETIIVAVAAVESDPYDASKSALVIGGTSAADKIYVYPQSNGRLRVQINGASLERPFHPKAQRDRLCPGRFEPG